MFGLTVRQLCCLIPAAGLSIGSYFLLKDHLGEGAILVALVLGLPLMLCGWWKPYGIPFEKFCKSILSSAILSPSKRKYKIENDFVKMFSEEETSEQKNQKKKKKKKYIPSSEEFKEV